MRGVYFEEATQEDLINAIKETIVNEVLVLMTTDEVSALLGCSKATIASYKNQGILTDHSTHNEYRKFSAKQVLELKRAKDGKRN